MLIIPILIVPYYSVIGGWVIKYLVGICDREQGSRSGIMMDIFQNLFQMEYLQKSALFMFCLITLAIIYAGVRNGIERVSKFMMPILVVLSADHC